MNYQIGIRREDKNKWERRVPLIPEHIQEFKEQYQINTIIQPSPIRVYPNTTFQQAGATIQEDLSSCPVVLAVKEIPLDFFQPGKTYVFFSHTIKGQQYNMPMLKKMMELGCTLIDYERIMNEKGFKTEFIRRLRPLRYVRSMGIGKLYNLILSKGYLIMMDDDFYCPTCKSILRGKGLKSQIFFYKHNYHEHRYYRCPKCKINVRVSKNLGSEDPDRS